MIDRQKGFIPIEKLKDRCTYYIRARNASIGIWIAEANSFLISRWKFGRNYLFEEIHFDASHSFGTVKPFYVVDDNAPILEREGKWDWKNGREILNYLNRLEMTRLQKKVKSLEQEIERAEEEIEKLKQEIR